jgi:hypothetical protein
MSWPQQNTPKKTFPIHAYRTPPSARRIQVLSLLSDGDNEEMVEEATMVVTEADKEEKEEPKNKEDPLPLSRPISPDGS